MQLKSILVLIDFGAQDAVALRRAGQLATAHRATLRLLHAPGRDAPPDASSRLLATARQLQERTGARVKTVPAPARTLRQAAAEARWSDLVVLGGRHEPSVAAFFIGQPAQRLLRLCACPLLLVRSPAAAPYERVLLAGDGARGRPAIALAAVLAPRAQLLHFEAALAGRSAAVQAIAGGQQTPADLVAVGTQRAPAWKEWLAPSVPRQLLRHGPGDLLLVPHGYAPPGRSAAARRLLRDQERCRSVAPARSGKRPS